MRRIRLLFPLVALACGPLTAAGQSIPADRIRALVAEDVQDAFAAMGTGCPSVRSSALAITPKTSASTWCSLSKVKTCAIRS